MKILRKILFRGLLPMLLMILVQPTAKAQGHYAGSSFNPNDYFIPPVSGWVFALYYSYTNMNYYNGAGKKADVIQLSQNPPLNIAVGQQAVTHSAIPMFIRFGKGKILNANWGYLVLPMFNNPNANMALDYYLGQTNVGSQSMKFNSFGLGDMYIQPVWLTWEKKKLSTTFSYGVWLPVGKYEPNSTDNIGMGYWSHNFRVANRYKPSAQYSIMGALTLEVNSQQKGNDFKEAPHLAFDFGGSYSFPKGHEVGLMGYGQWQLGEDQGSKATLPQDRIYSLGTYGAYWIKPGKLSVLGRFNYNFGARNRFAGLSFQLGINFLLM